MLPSSIASITTGVVYELRRGRKQLLKGRASYESGKPFGLRIASLPAVDGYSMVFVLVDQGEDKVCTGIAQFGIQADRFTKVNVELKCKSAGTTGTGGAGVDLDIIGKGERNCPKLGPIAAQPPVADVGKPIYLRTKILDEDVSSLKLAWFESSDPTAIFGDVPSVRYECAAEGSFVLTLRATRDNCQVQREIAVDCVNGQEEAEN